MTNLESSAPEGGGGSSGRQSRRTLRTVLEFVGDFDVVQATGVDLSEGGICFELDQALGFELRFEVGGAVHQRRACLVWAKPLDGGGCRCGFRFLGPAPDPEL